MIGNDMSLGPKSACIAKLPQPHRQAETAAISEDPEPNANDRDMRQMLRQISRIGVSGEMQACLSGNRRIQIGQGHESFSRQIIRMEPVVANDECHRNMSVKPPCRVFPDRAHF